MKAEQVFYAPTPDGKKRYLYSVPRSDIFHMVEICPDKPFQLKLQLQDAGQYRVTLVSDQGDRYTMFLNLFVGMLQKANMENGWISGWWEWVKQGASYSISYVGPIEED